MNAEEACNAASLKLCDAKAIVDLVAAVNTSNIQQGTLQTVALHLWTLVGEAKELVDEHWRPLPAKGGAA